jgi:hypothetical protein
MRRWLLPSVALVVVASTLAAPAAAHEEGRTWLAMGDSYSSGEGIPGTVDPDCQRATGVGTDATAWAVSAYRAVEDELGFTGQAFVACTGAITDDAAIQVGEAENDSAQPLQWDVVTFSFGGNNIGFVDVLFGCLDIPNGWDEFDLTPGCDIGENELRERIDGLVGNVAGGPYAGDYGLRGLYDATARHVAEGGDVLILGYPQLVEEVGRWDGWRRAFLNQCEGIEAYDVGMLRSATGYLNQQIALAAQAADRRHRADGIRFHFVDIANDPYEYSGNARDRHALCSQDPWLNGLTVGITDGDVRPERSFHPTQVGHDNTGRVLATYLRTFVRFDDGGFGPGATLDGRGFGPVEAGMTLAEAEQAAGVPLAYEESGAGSGGCGYARADGLDGVAFMVIDGVVQRADVDDPAIATDAGVHVGDPPSAVFDAYADVREEPHPYEPTGSYLTVEGTGADEGYATIFEVWDDGVVHTMRAGLHPAVDYIEGCA